MKILYFDCETTGLHPVQNDIFQHGGIIEINGQIETTFNLRCKPFNWNNITKEAEAVHGISKRRMRLFSSPMNIFKVLMNIFESFGDDKFILAGQGIDFDKRFLKAFFEKNNNYEFNKWFVMDKVIDLKKIVKKIVLLPNYKLTTIAAACNLKYRAHDAFTDIVATRLLIKHFQEIKKLRKKGLPFDLEIKKQGVEKC